MKISFSELRQIIAEEVRKAVVQEAKVPMMDEKGNWTPEAVVAVQDASVSLSSGAKDWVEKNIIKKSSSGAMRTRDSIKKAMQMAPKESREEILQKIAPLFDSDEIEVDSSQQQRAGEKSAGREKAVASRQEKMANAKRTGSTNPEFGF